MQTNHEARQRAFDAAISISIARGGEPSQEILASAEVFYEWLIADAENSTAGPSLASTQRQADDAKKQLRHGLQLRAPKSEAEVPPAATFTLDVPKA